MNLRVEYNMLLCVWVLIWITALIVLFDIVVFRANPEVVTATSVELRRAHRSNVCELGLKFETVFEQRSTDASICGKIKKNDKLILYKTKLLGRWIKLTTIDRERVSGLLLENRLLTDSAFVLFAIILPLILNLRLSNYFKKASVIIFVLEVIATPYFWSALF